MLDRQQTGVLFGLYFENKEVTIEELLEIAKGDHDKMSSDEVTGKFEIDGIPCIEDIRINGFSNRMSVKADENYIYLPMINELAQGVNAFYLKVDKRLFQIGEVQK